VLYTNMATYCCWPKGFHEAYRADPRALHPNTLPPSG